MKWFTQGRQLGRRVLDSIYCKDFPSKRQVGKPGADNWFVLTDRLEGAVIYSGGVGKDINFELELARNYNCVIHLFDPSPTGVNTIQSMALPSNILFQPIGLAGDDGLLDFALPVNPDEGSYRLGEGDTSFECRSLRSLFRENNHQHVELLKIDIEGFEYEVLDDVINSGLHIRQIAVEFHDFYRDISSAKTKHSVRLLTANGYTLFHKRGSDFSFVKR